MILQNATAKKRQLHGNILGSMSGSVFVISEELRETDRLTTLKKLQKAIILGFDSCIVTRSGTYATKKLSP